MAKLKCSLNPYAGVNWATARHHRGNLHAHTNQSDGRFYPDAVIDLYRNAGYTVLALTDHDSRHGLQNRVHNINHPGYSQRDRGRPDPENPALRFPDDYDHAEPDWGRVRFTEEQLRAIAAPTWPWSRWERHPGEFTPDPATGIMPCGMLAVKGNELSNHGHIASYFNDYASIKWRSEKAPPETGEDDLGTEHESLAGVGAAHGIAVLCHPGGEPSLFEHYAQLFSTHRHLVGMEVCQPWGHDATALWDRLLAHFMPERPAWGFGADDFHDFIHFGYGWNVFPLERLTGETLRDAMAGGRFFFSRANQLWHKKEGVQDPDFYRVRGRPPVIEHISVDNASSRITIKASGCDSIHWISRGREVGTGGTLDFASTPGIAGYARAELRRKDGWGIRSWTYTNPFGFSAT